MSRSPFKRPGDSPQKTGRRFEAFWARLFGVEPQRGSGNLWYLKLDVGDGSILWSCKHTDAESFRLSKATMREVEEAINGQGGIGGTILPGIATSVDGEVYCTLRAEDLLRILQSDAAKYIVPSKGEQKRSRARLPALLRDEDEGG
jgi:hypothetical protein